MIFKTIKSSEARKQLPKIMQEVDEQGKVYVFTVHGVAKTAMVDFELLSQFIENAEYGISEKEIVRRSKEETISLAEFKKQFDVQN